MSDNNQPNPDKMTLREFAVWRIEQGLRDGTHKRDIAKSLGVTLRTVYRYLRFVNLSNRHNGHD